MEAENKIFTLQVYFFNIIIDSIAYFGLTARPSRSSCVAFRSNLRETPPSYWRKPLFCIMYSDFSYSCHYALAGTPYVSFDPNRLLVSSFFVTVMANKIKCIFLLHTVPQTVSDIHYRSADDMIINHICKLLYGAI